VEGNRLQFNWASSQTGYGFTFTNYSAGGQDEYCQDLTVVYNHLSDLGAVIQTYQQNANSPSRHGRVVIDHLLAERINSGQFTGAGRMLQLLLATPSTPRYISYVVQHITCVGTFNHMVFSDGGGVTKDIDSLDMRNNVVTHGTFGYFRGGSSPGSTSITASAVSSIFTKNVMLSQGAGVSYPAGNAVGIAPNTVFTNFPVSTTTDYVIPSTSTYNNWGDDGADPGCDIATLMVKTAGCITGSW
jgi:hypothetical protein